MKVIDLLKYSASFYERDCTKRMKELSEIMELELNSRISDLSYGNKKKVGIVQGLLHAPNYFSWMNPPVVLTRSCNANSLT